MASYRSNIFARAFRAASRLAGAVISRISGIGLSLAGEFTDRAQDAFAWAKSYAHDISPSYPIELVSVLRKLVYVVPDLSQALKRIVYLANTGFDITLEGADEKTQELGQELIKEFFRDRPGIMAKMIRQVALTGALSAEAAPNMDLDDVDVRLVPTEDVRFKRLPVEGSETGATIDVPYQRTKRGTRELDPEQYTYEALETDEDNPYAIPPFLSALESAFIQRAGRSNIKAILDKLGMLGLIHVKQGKLPRGFGGEDDDDYMDRMQRGIEKTRDKIMKRIRSGIIFSYDDTTVTHTPIVGDARGHEPVWRANEEQFASGLDTDPALLGRSYSTTETYAGVVFSAFEAKLSTVRYPAERFIRDKALDQFLRLRGLRFVRLSWKWRKSATLNAESEARADLSVAQAQQIRQQTLLQQRDEGIINQQTLAEKLGYDKPAGRPLAAEPAKAKASQKKNESGCCVSADPKAIADYEARLTRDELDSEKLAEKLQDAFLRKFFRTYANHVKDLIARLPEDLVDAEDAADKITDYIERETGRVFADDVRGELRRAFADSWRVGANIRPVKTNWRKLPVPKDAIEWFTKANHHDIGKTFSGYRDEIHAAVVESLKSGDKTKQIRQLKKTIPGVLGNPMLEARLADVFRNLSNRARHFGRVKRFEEVGIQTADLVAVIDENTSSICKIADGKTFTISKLSKQVDDWLETEYDDTFWQKFRNPGETEARKNFDKWRKLTGDELAAIFNVIVPPLHFKCRTTLVIS